MLQLAQHNILSGDLASPVAEGLIGKWDNISVIFVPFSVMYFYHETTYKCHKMTMHMCYNSSNNCRSSWRQRIYNRHNTM